MPVEPVGYELQFIKIDEAVVAGIDLIEEVLHLLRGFFTADLSILVLIQLFQPGFEVLILGGRICTGLCLRASFKADEREGKNDQQLFGYEILPSRRVATDKLGIVSPVLGCFTIVGLGYDGNS